MSVCSASEPASDINAKVAQLDIETANLDKIISIFGEPEKYAWEDKTFQRQSLPSTYMAIYPGGLYIVMINDHITEIRFVKPFDSVKMLDDVIRLIKNCESLQTTSEKQDELNWISTILLDKLRKLAKGEEQLKTTISGLKVELEQVRNKNVPADINSIESQIAAHQQETQQLAEQMQIISAKLKSLDLLSIQRQNIQSALESVNRQLESVQEAISSLLLIEGDPVAMLGQSDPYETGWFRTRYISKAFLRCKRPEPLVTQATSDVQMDSIAVETKRVMAKLQADGFLENLFRRDKIRETKWFRDNYHNIGMEVSQFASFFRDYLTVKLTGTTDIEVTFSAPDASDSKAILDEMLKIFIIQENDAFDFERAQKLQPLRKNENDLKEKIRRLSNELYETVQKIHAVYDSNN